MRAFARLRRLYGEHAELTMRIDELEATFDESCRIVFVAIRAMQTPAITPRETEIADSFPARQRVAQFDIANCDFKPAVGLLNGVSMVPA